MRNVFLMLVVLIVFSAAALANNQSKAGGAGAIVAHAADRIVIGAYGDTRTGPYGLGDNQAQQIHLAVVRNLLRNKDFDAVLFTGDAVMTNFPLWAGRYWDSFLQKTNMIVKDNNIHFFPALGNHETYKWLPAFTLQTSAQMNFSPDVGQVSTENIQQSISAAYDRGEESASLSPKVSLSMVNPNTKEGQKAIETWESALERGSPQQKIDAALSYGQFEGAVQKKFYKSGADIRCAADASTFDKAYIKRANYDYLASITASQRRSYYSQVFAAGSTKVKLITLDTNCLDSTAQQRFFRRELANFDGKIVVLGHHPPVTDDAKGAMPWDVVPGWKDFRPYFSNAEGKNIVLWLFGHVHDYQRRSKNNSNLVPAPALVIVGGGGASLDSGPGQYQWQPEDWDKNFKVASTYMYLRMIFTQNQVEVEAFGSADPQKEFSSIDNFTISY
jgi:Calcineurin-like phosphoesterase